MCNSKFAGRRKPGGGYTYYDFLQDRSFDIAGPNPTPEEQKYIDQQYALYLERQRRSSVAADYYDAKQQEHELQQTSLRTEAERVPITQPRTEAERVPIPRPRPSKRIARRAAASVSRTRERNCSQPSFSCEWPHLSETIHDLRRLFGVAQDNKDGKS